MNITYDPDVDMLMIEFNDQRPFKTDSETIAGLSIMYDENGRVCAIEIEDASGLVKAPNQVNFEYLDSEQEIVAGD